MKNPLRTPEDYELFLYTLAENFPSVRRSAITFVRRGASLARVAGELFFDNVWKGEENLCWYDSQSHPDDPDLQDTDPHHKHVPPDIKHHRIPAPEMSFSRPNITVLIREIESLT
ncbi:toxin-antitoxin system TumE family protein [Desulfonema magnum]|uniref:Uncharacterized protein n=1 Tax=Desulfonema magnum TaxID=45655 RepID=A0A975BV71_9BACT|nr:DUF6516 family protein [Desulfonema magnum]QTA91735.1 Uncharacterized protein dnm_078090 [Desulfonema magnum]